MSEWTGILDKLMRAQAAHILDALDRPRSLVGREFLIAEDGESLLEAELKPIAASDAVAGQLWKYSCATMASIEA